MNAIAVMLTLHVFERNGRTAHPTLGDRASHILVRQPERDDQEVVQRDSNLASVSDPAQGV